MCQDFSQLNVGSRLWGFVPAGPAKAFRVLGARSSERDWLPLVPVLLLLHFIRCLPA